MREVIGGICDSWLELCLDLALLLQEVTHSSFLFASERHGLELSFPLIGNDDGVFSDLL